MEENVNPEEDNKEDLDYIEEDISYIYEFRYYVVFLLILVVVDILDRIIRMNFETTWWTYIIWFYAGFKSPDVYRWIKKKTK